MASPDVPSLLYKKIRKTDAGEGRAHTTSGVTLIRPIRGFFPDPTLEPGRRTTVDVILLNEDAGGLTFVGSGQAVVQLQGTGPETYLSEINSLKRLMNEGDLLLIEPSPERERHFTLTRVAKGSARFSKLRSLAVKPAGVIGGMLAAPDDVEQRDADDAVNALSSGAFEIFEPDAHWLPPAKRLARSRAFCRRVLAAYDRKCCICGAAGSLADGRSELEAAHIVSRRNLGADDVRNGLALCRAHHWAFDRNVIRIESDLTINFDPAFTANLANAHITSKAGSKLTVPTNPSEHPHPLALNWHRKQVTF